MEDLILQERETREKLVEVINNSKLPAILLKPMLEELLSQVSALEEQQYKMAKETKEKEENKKKKKGE